MAAGQWQLLWELLRSVQNGGQAAYFYVCDRTDFANAVMGALKAVIRRFAAAEAGQPDAVAEQLLYRLHVMTEYLPNLIGQDLETLWALTAGLCSPRADRRELPAALAALQQTDNARRVMGLADELLATLQGIVAAAEGPDDQALPRLVETCRLLQEEDTRCLHDLKPTRRAGIQVFERFERATLARGSASLLAALRQIPGVLGAFYQRVQAGVQHT